MEEFKFSPKQLEFLEDVRHHKLKFQNILEGSVRSGKTYVSLFAWLQLVGIAPKGMDFLNVHLHSYKRFVNKLMGVVYTKR